MELPIELIIGGVAYVVGNLAIQATTIMWLRSDLKKHDEIAGNHRADIKELYERVDTMMTSEDTADLVERCTVPIKEDIAETRVSLEKVSDSLNKITNLFSRMDERQVIQAEMRNKQNSRSSD